ASRERVEHDTTRRGDETDQPTHDFQGLDSTVLYPVHVRTLRLRGLRTVEKPRRAARIAEAVLRVPCASSSQPLSVDGRAYVSAALVVSRGLPHPALFVYPCGGVLVE